MGIATVYKRKWGAWGKPALIFVALALLIASIAAMVSPAAAQNAQADREKVVTAASGAWVRDSTIEVTMTIQNVSNPFDETVRFIDSNPNDSNRRFVREGASWCADGTKESLTLGTNSASGTLHYLSVIKTTASAQPRNCDGKLRSMNITIGNVSNAQNYSNDCSGLGLEEELQCIENREGGNAEFARVCTPPISDNQGTANLNNPLCAATPPPAGATPPATGEEEAGDEDREPHPCDSLGDFSLRWVTCPILTAGVAFTDAADAIIEDQLHYGANVFDESTPAGQNFKAAWNTFRTVGLSLILIIGLIMVVSQAANLQIFDAYAFRKTLPRLLIAVIGIALSWEILEFVIVFFNDIGHWVQDLVLAPFSNEADPTSSNPFATGAGFSLVISGALLGLGAGAIALGPLGIVSLIITVIMAILVGLFVLMTRSAIITLAILTAPLAIACWVLPGTKKVWDFWQSALGTALFIFPIIMLLIASGKAMSLVAENGIMKILFLILPYILLPFAFKLAGGLMSTVFSLTNDRSRGAFDRMKNFRRGQMKNRAEDAIQGTGKTWLSKNTGLARGVSGTLGSVYKRGHAASQYGGIGGAFGAKYAESRRIMGLQQADEALKRDNGRAAGNDDANELALKEGMTGEKFKREYAARMQAKGMTAPAAQKAASAALAQFESSYGVRMGSSAGAVTAWKALAASNTAYRDFNEEEGQDYHPMVEHGASLMARGLLDSSDATTIMKSNKARSDFAQIGFGTGMGVFDEAARRYKQGARGSQLLAQTEQEAAITGSKTVTQLRREALNGAQPGQLIGGRHEAIDALAPELHKRIEEAADASAVSGAGMETFIKELAQTAGLHDSMAQGNRLNADRLDDKVLSKVIGGNSEFSGKTVRQAIEMFRGDETFGNRRREYGNAATAQYAALQAQAGAGQPGGPGGPPTPGPIGG